MQLRFKPCSSDLARCFGINYTRERKLDCLRGRNTIIHNLLGKNKTHNIAKIKIKCNIKNQVFFFTIKSLRVNLFLNPKQRHARQDGLLHHVSTRGRLSFIPFTKPLFGVITSMRQLNVSQSN